MKIKVTHEVVYDTRNQDFMEEFMQYMDDHPKSFSGFQEFIIDRFINPNFDRGGETTMEIVDEKALTQCARCDSMLTFHDTTPGYYATCPYHDEDLDKWECK
jgi:hypothetical protein